MRVHKRRVRDNNVTGNAAIATHFFELTKASQANLTSFSLRYGATLVATFTLDTTNFEDVAFDSTTAGDWHTETDVTITAAATALAGKTYHAGNLGALRVRIKAVVTTAGALDIATCEKSG